MFKYGKKAGYMGIALLVLAVIPLVVAACVIPNIGPEVATKFNAAGEVTRWGKSYELLALPVLNLLLSVATYFTAGRQAILKTMMTPPPWRASCASATCVTVASQVCSSTWSTFTLCTRRLPERALA